MYAGIIGFYLRFMAYIKLPYALSQSSGTGEGQPDRNRRKESLRFHEYSSIRFQPAFNPPFLSKPEVSYKLHKTEKLIVRAGMKPLRGGIRGFPHCCLSAARPGKKFKKKFKKLVDKRHLMAYIVN
ncbi:MAG: hypothetical protein QME28_02440 [Candidatus Saccharicenans sp.]|nr:hypothetical protein [Candidatus Saccharicenans sp.]